MKNNYNPFTVPENFFEDARSSAIAAYNRRKRNLRNCFAAGIIAAVVLLVPTFLIMSEKQLTEKEIAANSLAQMYEYDIFLQVNF